MGALPELRVEVAWGASPATVLAQNGVSPPSITWTDITGYVHFDSRVSVSRGRASEDDTVSAGSLSLTLKPSATTLVSQMRIRTPIRVSVRHPKGDTDASWIPVWTGTVNDWGVRWDNGLRVMMPLSASDMVARFEAKPVDALPVQAILSTNPVWCFPLDEEEDTTAAADRVGVVSSVPLLKWVEKGTTSTETGKFGGLYSPGSPPTHTESTTAAFAPNTAGTVGWYLSSGSSASLAFPEIGTVADGQTIQAFVYVAGTSSRTTSVLDLRGFLTDVALDLMPSWKPRARVQVYGTGIVAEVTAATAITTEGWHHVALTQKQTGSTVTLTLYVDGTSAGTATYAGPLLTAGSFEISAGAFSGGDLFFGNIANVAAHDRALSSAEIADIASTRNGNHGQGAVARAYAIARWAGLSAKIPSTGFGDSAMQAQEAKGGSVGDALRLCATAEMSTWFCTPSGVFRMDNRSDRYSPPTAFTIPARCVDQSTQFTVSDQFLRNVVTASRPGGATITVRDTASIGAYETYAYDVEALLTDDLTVNDYATALLERYKTPQPRSDQVTINMTTSSTDLDATAPGTVLAMLNADIGTAFAISGLPPDAPTNDGDRLRLLVEGVSDDFGPSGWTRSFNVSSAATVAAWILGDDTPSWPGANSRLGQTTYLMF